MKPNKCKIPLEISKNVNKTNLSNTGERFVQNNKTIIFFLWGWNANCQHSGRWFYSGQQRKHLPSFTVDNSQCLTSHESNNWLCVQLLNIIKEKLKVHALAYWLVFPKDATLDGAGPNCSLLNM
jgi:hypothetical protein